MPVKAQNDAEVQRQHNVINNTEVRNEEFQRNEHPDAQWFGNAGLGLFLHWGLSSVLGQYDLSWGMMKCGPGNLKKHIARYGLPAVRANVTPRYYWKQAESFNPDKYDPNKWLAAAKAAGMTYAVFTTRHHDGFSMWPSEYGDFNTKNYMSGRDLVGEFVEACRNNGLKVGLYYSPPDWRVNQRRMSFGFDKSQPLDIDHQPCTLTEPSKEHDNEYNDYVRNQVVELLTRYGKIDLLWFDGALPRGEQTISFEEMRTLQPGIVVNPRGHGYGDYLTPECKFPAEPYQPGQWWELCYVFSDGAWAYLNHECYKPCGWVLEELGKVRAWDGNFLISVGPDSHGELPSPYYHRMSQLADWMKHSGEAVKNTSGGIWPEQCNVPVTVKNSDWYVHVSWSCDEEVIITEIDKPIKAVYLRTGEAVEYKYNDRKLSFTFPENSKTIETDIIKMTW